MKRKFMLLGLLILIINTAFGQYKKFSSLGVSLDFIDCPTYRYTYEYNNFLYSFQDEKTEQLSSFAISLRYRYRYNLIELNSDNALSANISPTLGFGSYNRVISDAGPYYDGSFSFILPLYLQYDLGAGATYFTKQKHGFALSTGFEYIKAPLFSKVKMQDGYSIIDDSQIKKSWIQPSIGLSYVKYKQNKNRLFELNLKYGFGNNLKELRDYSKPNAFTISFNYSLDYQKKDERLIEYENKTVPKNEIYTYTSLLKVDNFFVEFTNPRKKRDKTALITAWNITKGIVVVPVNIFASLVNFSVNGTHKDLHIYNWQTPKYWSYKLNSETNGELIDWLENADGDYQYAGYKVDKNGWIVSIIAIKKNDIQAYLDYQSSLSNKTDFSLWDIAIKALKCYVIDQIAGLSDNPAGKAILAEAISSVIEERSIDINSIAEETLTGYVVEELEKNGHENIAKMIEGYSFLKCMLD